MCNERGVTLLEILITMVIILILASVALPLSKIGGKRSKELELRQTLRTIRIAIDNFRRDWARDGDILQGTLCVKNKLTCKEFSGATGYPKTLETLLFVELSGEEALVEEISTIRRYLRRIPYDPMTQSQEWGLRCYQDEADQDNWCGEDVYDVFTTSSGIAIDGTKYRNW